MKAMKLIPILTLITTFAVAQEIQQIPSEQIAKIAGKAIETLGSPSDAPFSVDADASKAAGIQAGGDTGLLAIPDRKLAAEAVAGAGKTVSGIAQLWMRNVVLAVNNAAADPAKLRTVTFREGDNEAKAEAYFIGVSKTDSGALELALFAKDKEPLVKVPLVKTETAASSVPIALDGRKEGENRGVLVVTIFGSYKADIAVTRPRE